jgi:predicted transcriptional regulator of viral defense system
MKYKGLSKDEIYLISRAEFEKQKLITREFTLKLFTDYKKADNILNRLTKKGRLLQITRGKYFIVPIKAPDQLWTPNEFITAKYWMNDTPYYIGYFTMYNYWGFSEQIPQIVYILNTKKSETKKISNINFKAVKITEKKYYGIKKIKIEDEEINISDKERTLIDLIYNPPGSFSIMKSILIENIDKMDLNKFSKYLAKYPIRAIMKRAGYILENYGINSEQVNKMKKELVNDPTYVVLNPEKKSRKGKINKDWKLIINE